SPRPRNPPRTRGHGDGTHDVRTRGSRYAYARSASRLKKITDALKTRNRPCNMGRSGARMAVYVACPRPGHEKIDSTVIAPEGTKPKLIALRVKTGRRALGTACVRRTTGSRSALARARIR